MYLALSRHLWYPIIKIINLQGLLGILPQFPWYPGNTLLTSQVYLALFPHFWYPVKNILMSWAAYLIMGIATERYLAVCR